MSGNCHQTITSISIMNKVNEVGPEDYIKYRGLFFFSIITAAVLFYTIFISDIFNQQ